MKKIFFYSMFFCIGNVQQKIISLTKRLVLALMLGLLASFTISANTAYTGMRDITSMQLTAGMGAGWNLGNTLDAHGSWVSGLETETCWGNPKTTKAMIDAIKQKGFKTIRIPVTWYQHLGAAPDYTIDAAWLNRVEEVTNYAFANDMYVIINIHHDDSWIIPTYAKQDAVIAQITKVWTQIANRFKDYGDYLIFETLNEPRLVGSSEEWSGGTAEGRDVVNKFHLASVNAIRNTGGNNASRHIMVSPYGASGEVNAIDGLVIPNNDSRVIISWHNYSPYNFVMQIPGTNTWGTSSEQADLNALFDRLNNKFIKNGRAVVIGEWSPTDKNNTSERAKYAEFFVKAAKSRQMVPIWWDNGDLNGGDSDGGSAIFDRKTITWKYPTIADAIINNIGTCNPTAITPYVQVNGSWQQTSSVTVSSGASVKFGPQPVSGGTWSWSGLASGTSREVTIYPTASGTATATYTNSCGATSSQVFTVTVNGSTGSSITVRARGSVGGEQIRLVTGGSTIETWTLTTSYQNYSATGTGTVQVFFINDNGNYDVQVDYVIIDGTTYQSESQSKNTGVWQNNTCGGSYSEWLHCNGYIEFTSSESTSVTLTIQENVTGFCSVDGSIDSNNSGYTGAGFANTNNASGSGITWSVNIPSAGSYNLAWRYANGGSSDRTGQLMIDGSTVVSSVSMPSTGSWTSWTTSPVTSVNLSAGTRRIRLQATKSEGLSNIDYMNITGVNPTGVSCTGQKSANSSLLADAGGIRIYPNPVKHIINIAGYSESGSEANTVVIYNELGKVMRALNPGAVSAGSFDKSINVEGLHPGMYFIRVIIGSGVNTMTFIKE